MALRPRTILVEVKINRRARQAVEAIGTMAELIESLAEDLAWRDEPKELAAALHKLTAALEFELRME